MPSREQVVAEARKWIGTPFHHQADQLGLGCDCAGLLRGVGVGIGIVDPGYRNDPEYRRMLTYRRQPDGKELEAVCDSLLIIKSNQSPHALAAADIVMLKINKQPQHLGIVAPYIRGGLSVIHAAARNGVIETRLLFHRAFTLVKVYQFPGVSDG